MPRRLLPLLVLCLLAALPARPARAEVVEKTGTFAGAMVTYQVVLPAGYDPAKAYPAVVVFAGGGQTLEGTRRMVENTWRKEAERRGFLIFAPASPDAPDQIFYETADRIFPEFFDRMLADYKVQGKLHVAGPSNGGISALHVAVRWPQYFASVTGYPGMFDRSDISRSAPLRNMCLFLHVGSLDSYWVQIMTAQVAALKQRDMQVSFTIEPNQPHGIRTPDLPVRLFNQIQGCTK